MGKLRIFGSILITSGSILMLIPIFELILTTAWDISYLGFLVLPLLALLAGILVISDKLGGAIIAVVISCI